MSGSSPDGLVHWTEIARRRRGCCAELRRWRNAAGWHCRRHRWRRWRRSYEATCHSGPSTPSTPSPRSPRSALPLCPLRSRWRSARPCWRLPRGSRYTYTPSFSCPPSFGPLTNGPSLPPSVRDKQDASTGWIHLSARRGLWPQQGEHSLPTGHPPAWRKASSFAARLQKCAGCDGGARCQ